MDPNQIIGMGVDTYNALDSESKHALTYPAAKTLGLAADGLISIFCYHFLKARIFTQARLKQYQEETAAKINKIPEENRDSSKLGLVIKAIEESRYQLNEDDIRKMYVNLIASTVDSRKNSVVNPRLATVVAQFGIKEAHIMKKLAQSESKLLLTSQLWEIDGSSDYWITPCFLSIDNELTSEYASSIDTLKSLGVVDDFPDRALTETKYKEEYSDMEKYIKGLNQLFRHQEKTTRFKNGYIKLSNFGNDLARCIFE